MERVADPTVVSALLSIVATTRNKLATIGVTQVSQFNHCSVHVYESVHVARACLTIHSFNPKPFFGLSLISFTQAEVPLLYP